MIRTLMLLLCFTVVFSFSSFADDTVTKVEKIDPAERWEATIKKFEKQDVETAPKKGEILFAGSSSIRMWDEAASFPDRVILNRGFGGSQISDVLYYLDRVVLKYEPRVIVFYCGDNDINNKKSPQRVFNDYKVFTQKVHAKLPETDIIFLPIKPSLSRWSLWPEMSEANQKIRQLSEADKRLHYCDTVPAMLNEQGTPLENVFLKDGLHMNAEGYAIWDELLEKMLKQLD
ncbi:MAG: hypothetical protein JKY95_16555 [Planctomycetaceae bacterium]|nr:hypothetical protein [Planctomycetaceae bacterium]